MPGKNYIKVTSILLIISGVIAMIIYPLGGLLLGWATVDTKEKMGWIFVVISLLYTIAAILQFIAGLKGVKGCDKKEAVADLKVWGKLTLIIFLISGVVECASSILHGVSPLMSLLNIVLAFVLPGLYLHGVSLNEKA